MRRIQEAARSMADELASAQRGMVVEPIVRMGAKIVDLSTLWVGPVRALMDQQQALIEAMELWAKQQRDLAERFARLAEEQRRVTSYVMKAITPQIEQIEQVRAKARSVSAKPKKKP